ncbi:uncharacterized protein LOC144095631 [Amblyomma americanum]
MAQAAGSAGGQGNQPAVIASTEQTITIDGDTHAHPLLVQQWTDDTKLWPSITSAHIVCCLIRSKACDLKEAEAYKSLDSYNQLQCGWVGRVLSHEAAADIVYVKADVRPSQAVNKKPWSPWACVRKNGQVVTAGCSCMAGKARACSHIGALLWKLEMGVQLGITGISCTDKAAAWNRGTKRNVEPALLNSMSFNLKRSTVDPASTQHPRPTRKVKHFASKEELADHIKKSPYGEVLNIPGTLLHNTLMTTRREIQQPSQAPASVQRQQATHHSEKVAFQSPKCKERQLNKVEPPVDDFEITLERPLCNLNFGKLLGSERAVDKLSLTITSAKNIEAATREQRNCAEWFSHRKGRITASLFKDVY